MSSFPLLPAPPAPNHEWLHQFTGHLLAKRPGVSIFSARVLALQAFQEMHLLTPHEACELWDQFMIATNPHWRRLAGR